MGQAFIAMHWGDEFVGGSASSAGGVNALTLGKFDAASKQPELKHAALRIEAAGLPWRYQAFGRVEARHQLWMQSTLRSFFASFGYASAVPFGHDDGAAGVLFRAAAAQPVQARVLDDIEALFGLDGAAVQRYDDPRRGSRRRVRVTDDHVRAVALAGSADIEIDGEAWLRSLLESGASAAAAGRALLFPALAAALAAQGPRARIVCNCFNIDEDMIDRAARACGADDRIAEVQRQLQCGTSCGSCLPELRRRIAQALQLDVLDEANAPAPQAVERSAQCGFGM